MSQNKDKAEIAQLTELELGKLGAKQVVVPPALLLVEVCTGALLTLGLPVFQEKKKQRPLWRREIRALKATSGNYTLQARGDQGRPGRPFALPRPEALA